ncbi:MAG TPA: hypothetical protein DCL72_08505 [Rhizobiales bacterium]|jgi:Protein of unknown function (DUF2939)|nr:hypothetical protein [Hyphomicrobiales bacterium]HAN62819.1 hypothetical protein [Hyphomicrobiales bacterium]
MRKWFLGAAALLVAYIAYPYLTLFWLDRAVLTGNTASLESLIDWPLVRQQLKADVKLALIQSAQTQVGKRNFAGIFGGALTALLAPTVVDSAVDEWVTPEKLVNNEEVVKRRQEQKSFADFVTYAFFTSPTAFRADLRDPKDPKSPTLTVLMALSGVRWRVVALKLPPPETWLSKPGTRTPSDDAAPVPQ